MAKITDFYRVVSPTQSAATIQDSQQLDQGYAFSSNYTWYQRLIQGSATRLTRYREYDIMDQDVEIARALDIIAEEMTSRNTKTDMVLNISMQIEDGQEVEDTIVLTLRSALRHWSILHGFTENRLFKIARNMIKYGDCFFKVHSSYKKWEWIPASNVIGAVVDAQDVTKVLAYQVRMDSKVPNSNSAAYNSTGSTAVGSQAYTTEIIPVEHMAVFSINDDMSETAPFGDSALRTVYKTHKQKELLEDAIVIYRIQRAPERRVFYIDVGKMQPNRVKAYLETIKNEIRQKKIPSNNQNGKDSVDAVYNPQCISLDTKIPLLDGRVLSLSEIIVEHQAGNELWAYSVNHETGEQVPGIISWAGITRKDSKVIKITFDNNESLICTADHKIPVQGKGFVNAEDLNITDSLFPFNLRLEKLGKYTYTQTYDTNKQDWQFVHRMVNKFFSENQLIETFVYDSKFLNNKKDTIHHRDINRYNNSPSNLMRMNSKDHILFHANELLNPNRIAGIENHRLLLNTDTEYRAQFVKKLSDIGKNRWLEFNEIEKQQCIQRLIDNKLPTINQLIIFDEKCLNYCIKILHNNPTISIKQFMIALNNNVEFMNYYANINQYEKVDGVLFNYKIDTSHITHSGFHKLIKLHGYDNFKTLRNKIIQEKVRLFSNHDSSFNYIKQLIVDITPCCNELLPYIRNNVTILQSFIEWYRTINPKTKLKLPDAVLMNKIGQYYGYDSWNGMLAGITQYNHKIIAIEYLDETMDVGTLTIDQNEVYHNYHTFAIDAGIFIKNSQLEDIFLAQRADGKGSKVEVLPGGQSLGEMTDLDYFMDKVLRGLRVPISWMKTGVNSAMFNDGKIGAAYVEEQQFAKFVERLQVYIEVEIDKAFKQFLFASNINIDETLYKIKLPAPSNYEHYQQAEVDTTLLNSLSQAEAIPYMSKRFILSRYGQLTEDEIITNEQLLKQERGLDPDADKSLNQIYGAPAEGAGGLGGGGMGGLGGGMGGMGLGEPGAEGDLGVEGGLPGAEGAEGVPETPGAEGATPAGSTPKPPPAK